jgi:hypothetical protein
LFRYLPSMSKGYSTPMTPLNNARNFAQLWKWRLF